MLQSYLGASPLDSSDKFMYVYVLLGNHLWYVEDTFIQSNLQKWKDIIFITIYTTKQVWVNGFNSRGSLAELGFELKTFQTVVQLLNHWATTMRCTEV